MCGIKARSEGLVWVHEISSVCGIVEQQQGNVLIPGKVITPARSRSLCVCACLCVHVCVCGLAGVVGFLVKRYSSFDFILELYPRNVYVPTKQESRLSCFVVYLVLCQPAFTKPLIGFSIRVLLTKVIFIFYISVVLVFGLYHFLYFYSYFWSTFSFFFLLFEIFLLFFAFWIFFPAFNI